MLAPRTTGHVVPCYQKFCKHAIQPMRELADLHQKNSTRRQEADRSDAYTIRAKAVAIDPWQNQDRSQQRESCETRYPTRRTTDIPICRASREYRVRKNAASQHCDLSGVAPLATAHSDHPSANRPQRSGKIAWSTAALHNLGDKSCAQHRGYVWESLLDKIHRTRRCAHPWFLQSHSSPRCHCLLSRHGVGNVSSHLLQLALQTPNTPQLLFHAERD